MGSQSNALRDLDIDQSQAQPQFAIWNWTSLKSSQRRPMRGTSRRARNGSVGECDRAICSPSGGDAKRTLRLWGLERARNGDYQWVVVE
jgi:hypothetical protein